MSIDCECHEKHFRRRIVLTGGPGAGKTAVLELLRQSLCDHVKIVPEAAGVVFGGGFPRRSATLRPAQRAIYHVQIELEAAAESEDSAVTLCDRGAIDGSAYWPGPDSLWESVGVTREEMLRRYDAVIHLRVPPASLGYGRQNPLRVESALEARQIDDRILEAWHGHPRRYIVEPAGDFIEKARRALEILRTELPECCRDHASHAVSGVKQEGDVLVT